MKMKVTIEKRIKMRIKIMMNVKREIKKNEDKDQDEDADADPETSFFFCESCDKNHMRRAGTNDWDSEDSDWRGVTSIMPPCLNLNNRDPFLLNASEEVASGLRRLEPATFSWAAPRQEIFAFPKTCASQQPSLGMTPKTRLSRPQCFPALASSIPLFRPTRCAASDTLLKLIVPTTDSPSPCLRPRCVPASPEPTTLMPDPARWHRAEYVFPRKTQSGPCHPGCLGPTTYLRLVQLTHKLLHPTRTRIVANKRVNVMAMHHCSDASLPAIDRHWSPHTRPQLAGNRGATAEHPPTTSFWARALKELDEHALCALAVHMGFLTSVTNVSRTLPMDVSATFFFSSHRGLAPGTFSTNSSEISCHELARNCVVVLCALVDQHSPAVQSDAPAKCGTVARMNGSPEEDPTNPRFFLGYHETEDVNRCRKTRESAAHSAIQSTLQN